MNDDNFQITNLNVTITFPKRNKAINNNKILISKEIIWQFIILNYRKDNKIYHNG
jgi:hypothetical protein